VSLLNKDALLASAATLPVERVEVPEIADGAYVLVRGLTGTQRDAYEKSMWVQKGRKSVRADNLRAKLIVKCLVDDQGNLQYSDADIAVIGRLRADVLERVFDACRRLSGMTDEEREEKKDDSETEDGSVSPSN
jgi:hypothetical protein